MKGSKWLYFVLIILITIISSIYAHSGRTDSRGGHRDTKNVSGLGSYHFHHGKSAHLHPNGVCPYDTIVNKDNSDSNSSYWIFGILVISTSGYFIIRNINNRHLSKKSYLHQSNDIINSSLDKHIEGNYHQQIVQDTNSNTSVTCPLCGYNMTIRHGKYGRFYGCVKYPYCRGTRSYKDNKIRRK